MDQVSEDNWVGNTLPNKHLKCNIGPTGTVYSTSRVFSYTRGDHSSEHDNLRIVFTSFPLRLVIHFGGPTSRWKLRDLSSSCVMNLTAESHV